MSKALVCSGFHRSATSATANYLHNAGLNMGYELMGNSAGNVLGHFEDWPIVRLHDEQLALAGSSWQFCDEVPLTSDSSFLESYIKLRNSKDTNWGVKDPRASLFLPEWKHALGEKGYFLLVIRHWSSCIESLLHRESRNLAHFLYPAAAASFWQKPDLSAKMWLAYNRRLLAFVKENKTCTLLVSQRALFHGAPIISTLNQRFGFQLDSTALNPLDLNLIRDSACITIKESLSFSLRVELEVVWKELLDLADLRAQDETPNFNSVLPLDKNFLNQYLQTFQDFTKSRQTVIFTKSQLTSFDVMNKLNETDFIAQLDQLSGRRLDKSDCQYLELLVERRFPLNGKALSIIAFLYQEQKEYTKAISLYSKAMLLGYYFPFVSMQVGSCFKELGHIEESLFFYDKALKENPENSQFYLVKTRLLIEQAEPELAMEVFNSALNNLGMETVIIESYVNFLLSLQKTDCAREILEKADLEHKDIAALRVRLDFLLDPNKGLTSYHRVIVDGLAGKNRFEWLVKVTCTITNASAELDLLRRCFKHWDDLLLE
jgi:tetratricopeptide (TPR) repeat protein